MGRDGADGNGHGAIADVPVQGRTDVDRKQVPFAQDAVAGNPVNDLVVHRGADRRREAVVAFKRRNSPALADALLRHAIEVAGRDSGPRGFHQVREHRRRYAAAAAHRLDLARGL
jgi:MOSC domain-containing protein YiiM